MSSLDGVLGSGTGDGSLLSPGKRSPRPVAASSLNGLVLTTCLVKPLRTKAQVFDLRRQAPCYILERREMLWGYGRGWLRRHAQTAIETEAIV